MRNSTYLPACNWYGILILWSRCLYEDVTWSRLQHVNCVRTAKGVILPEQMKGKGEEEVDLNDKWREVERELGKFVATIESGTEREKRFVERSFSR